MYSAVDVNKLMRSAMNAFSLIVDGPDKNQRDPIEINYNISSEDPITFDGTMDAYPGLNYTWFLSGERIASGAKYKTNLSSYVCMRFHVCFIYTEIGKYEGCIFKLCSIFITGLEILVEILFNTVN